MTGDIALAPPTGYDEVSGNGRRPPGPLLDEVVDALTRYVAFPTIEAADAVALFIAATHAQSAWEHATRLVIKSPVRRCGKTRLLEVAVELCHQPLATTNISVAALVRSIGHLDPPTIVLDEADPVFATRRGERSETAEDLRGILNSGHARGWPYIRWDAATRKTEKCPTFAMAVLAGIGDLPDTIEDRAVIVTMRRRGPGEDVDRFRRRRSVPPLHDLRERLHEWVTEHRDDLAEIEPDLPVEDRAADVWEPLVAVAELAGGDWPKRAREACARMAGAGTGEEDAGARLLADIHAVFGEATKMHTATLLDRLNGLEDAPWGGWHRGEGLNSRAISRILRPYGVSPRKVRIGDSPPLMGYTADDLADPWSRYVPAQQALFRNEKNNRNGAGRDVPEVPAVPEQRLPVAPPALSTESEDEA